MSGLISEKVKMTCFRETIEKTNANGFANIHVLSLGTGHLTHIHGNVQTPTLAYLL